MAACSAAASSGRLGSFSEKLRQRQIAEDAGEQVVEVVRDPAGHLADHFHLLRLPELLFELEFLGDVVDKDQFRGPAVHGQVEGGDLDVDDRAVLGAVPPVDWATPSCDEPRAAALADVVVGHPEEFGSRIAVLVDSRVVHGEEPVRLAVDHPHRVGVRVEQEPVALLAAAQGVGSGAAIGNVALDHDPVGGAAVGVGDRHERQIDPEAGAVLPVIAELDAERLALVEGDANLLERGRVGVRPAEEVKRAADHLGAVVAGHVAEGVVDVEDGAARALARLGLHHHDCVVGVDDGRFEQAKPFLVPVKGVGGNRR